MFLRKTTRKNRDGSTVEYYQLAHNVWNPTKKHATAKIIHNFGRADLLDHDELVRLCKSIARVCGLVVTDPAADSEGVQPHDDGDVLTAGVKQIITRPLGAVLAITALWEELGIGKHLRELQRRDKCKVKYERVVVDDRKPPVRTNLQAGCLGAMASDGPPPDMQRIEAGPHVRGDGLATSIRHRGGGSALLPCR